MSEADEAGRPGLNRAQIVRSLMIDMQSRGKDATGLLTVSNGRHKLRKAPVPAGKFITDRVGAGSSAQTALIHTRASTQGSPSNNLNNHPIAYGNIVGVHNGVIYNDYEVFRENKWERKAQVDSEAIFAALAHVGDPVAALEMIRGWMAIAWVDLAAESPTTLNLAKGDSSPLHIAMTPEGSLFFASTAFALNELLKYEYVDEFLMMEEVKKEGWILSYDPRGPGEITDRWNASDFTPPKWTRATSYAGGFYGDDDYAWTGESRWSLTEPDFIAFDEAERQRALEQRVLGTHSQAVDNLSDPFDDEPNLTDGSAERSSGGVLGRAGSTFEGLAFVRPGDRVMNRRGMIGTVVAPDNESGDCIVEWDASVECIEDLDLATSDDEETTAKLYTQHLAALELA